MRAHALAYALELSSVAMEDDSDVEDMEDDAGADDAASAEEAESEQEDKADGNTQEDTQDAEDKMEDTESREKETSEPCVLIVTDNGFAKRVQVQQLGISKKGRRGNKGISIRGVNKGNAETQVVGIEVVGGATGPVAPEKPKVDWELFLDDHPEMQIIPKEFDENVASWEDESRKRAQDKWTAISEEQKKPYAEQAETLRVQYDQDMKAFKEAKTRKKARTEMALFKEKMLPELQAKGLCSDELTTSARRHYRSSA